MCLFAAGGGRDGNVRNSESNDVGLFWPPGRAQPVLVTAYLTGSTAEAPMRDATLADVGAAVAAAIS
jgi:beta-lactamase class A